MQPTLSSVASDGRKPIGRHGVIQGGWPPTVRQNEAHGIRSVTKGGSMKVRPLQLRSGWTLLAALVAAAALAVSACGGGSSDQQVIAGSQAEGLAGVEKPELSELSARELVIATMTADLAESSRLRVTTETGGAARQEESEIDEYGNTRTITRFGFGLDDPELEASVEMLVVDDEVYGRIGFPEELLDESGFEFPDGWMTVGRETMELFGVSCGPPVPGSGTDGEECVPPNDLSEMADFVLEATIVGQETVRGVETIRVRTAIDFKSLMEAALGDDSDVSFMDLIIATMPSEVPMELWVDDDFRVHRMSMDITVDTAALGDMLGEEIEEEPTQRVVMDFYDFGADIVIEAPPPDEIVGEFGDWLEDLGFPFLIDEVVSDSVSTA